MLLMQHGPALSEDQSLSSARGEVRGTPPGTQGFSGRPQPCKEYRGGNTGYLSLWEDLVPPEAQNVEVNSA